MTVRSLSFHLKVAFFRGSEARFLSDVVQTQVNKFSWNVSHGT